MSHAQTFKTLLNFEGTEGQGGSLLVQGFDGDFYGTTQYGGPHNARCGANGCGTVFKVAPWGRLTTLYRFCTQPKGTNCPDGGAPSNLVQGNDGNFYGTTISGGTDSNCPWSSGCGTVFKITPTGTLTTLYNFCSLTNCADGDDPNAGLVQGTDGNLYGTTFFGGAHEGPCSDFPTLRCGTVFRITPSDTLTTLHSFCAAADCTDGIAPLALVQGADGNFYGTTGGGGNGRGCGDLWHCGTVFRLSPAGTLTTLYTFCTATNCPDGSGVSGLIQAADGNFYGTTSYGGVAGACPFSSAQGCGTVFKVTPGGTLTTLYSFCSQTNCPDGDQPSGGVVQATDGNLYGTTWQGGTSTNCSWGCGTIFKITPHGTLTTLHTFDGTDGYLLSSGPIQATNGTLYGTTLDGGAYNQGTIFSLCVGLGWFVESVPTTGTVGATINILGTDFTGATGVAFDGTPAPFTIISPTQIQTTVPPGATTGSVKVTIPSGTMSSKPRFRVLPQFTSFSPSSGPAGTVVTITGVSLAQTIRVGIGGVSASFTVVDDTTVTATVPTGATTGKKIVVTTHGGNVASATTFTVTE